MANDGGIQFPPGQRRGKPSFEPPPWERDQFEELARRKQAEREAQTVEAEPPAGPVDVGQGRLPEAERPEGGVLSEEPPSDEPRSGPAAKERAQIDETQVTELMMGLRAEEPRPEKMYWKIVAGSGVVSTLIGLMISTWAVAVMVAPKQAGGGEVLFEVTLLLSGLGFVAGGAWVVFKSLRQQGVL